MPDQPATTRLRVSASSIVLAVGLFGLTIAALAMLAASTRVIGWILTAIVVAGLLHPAVVVLGRWVPRGVGLAAVAVVSLAAGGFIGYRVVNDVNDQLKDLQRALPRAARDIERSDRFGEVATDARLAARVEAFVEELPERLRGGNAAEALRSAATRGVAFLATAVLTIFFLIHGRRLLDAAASQLSERRQRRIQVVGAAVYARSWRYVTGSLAMATVAGFLSYGCARALDLPGGAPLALWMALVDFIPLVGVVLGALPLVLLAAATLPAWQTVLVALVLIGYQVLEAVYLQKRVEQMSLHIGPFVTIAVAMVGLELYGIGGALIALVLTVLLAATADEVVGLAPEPDEAPPVTSPA